MGGKGPPKTPTAKLRLVGSHLAKSREGQEPVPPDRKPVAQIEMTDDEKKMYSQVCKMLRAMNIQAASDGNGIARYVRGLVRYNEVSEFLADRGDTYSGVDGTVKRYPQSTIRNELDASLLRLEREFGLTPSARASIHVQKPKANSDLEARYFG